MFEDHCIISFHYPNSHFWKWASTRKTAVMLSADQKNPTLWGAAPDIFLRYFADLTLTRSWSQASAFISYISCELCIRAAICNEPSEEVAQFAAAEDQARRCPGCKSCRSCFCKPCIWCLFYPPPPRCNPAEALGVVHDKMFHLKNMIKHGDKIYLESNKLSSRANRSVHIASLIRLIFYIAIVPLFMVTCAFCEQRKKPEATFHAKPWDPCQTKLPQGGQEATHHMCLFPWDSFFSKNRCAFSFGPI